MAERGFKVVSFIPGRVRLKVDALKGDADLASAVSDDLAGVPAIKSVDANSDTGSVLIRYDRKKVSAPESIESLSDILTRHFPDMDVSLLEKWLGKKA